MKNIGVLMFLLLMSIPFGYLVYLFVSVVYLNGWEPYYGE